ncbi:nuclear transport factor 2 family protein [Sphaerisporangium dianthi]|uniref:Nuclear transport factor 2 family protein n=1 Tax=Sphaerisporangium dianthi TaxID=1436120 RepID=A0ABV9CFK0_9ACTN
MAATPQEIFQRYLHAGALTRDPAALAELFTEDGVYEAPLVPPGGVRPRRLVGRAQIREGMAASYAALPPDPRTVDPERSRVALHVTGDPDVFIVELDPVFDGPDGTSAMALVQIFRCRDGKIALLRDYYSVEQAG